MICYGAGAMMRCAVMLFVALAALAFAPAALAWREAGHHIAADIAEQYLAPDTARQVRALLALDNAGTLAEVAGWADEIGSRRPETLRWHFVNIPVHPPAGTPMAYDAARDCPTGDCVVAAIDRFETVLADQARPARERLEALKFLVHLVADIHQPLHCGDDGDRGGNDTHVIFLGRPTTLHALWDDDMIAALHIPDEHAYALKLAKAIPPARLAQWQSGDAAQWATESYGIARLIYGGSHEPRALQIFYETDFVPTIDVQLEKAGLRLAMVLNRALR
jgi:hypothetical protein